MYIYAVYRHGNRRVDDWNVYKLFKEKSDADAFVSAKNPNACSYAYAVKKIKVY